MIKKVVMIVKYNILGYLIGEGFSNVFKNKKSTGASLMIMCATMIIFGSWRRSARRPFAKVMPALALVCVWLTPGILYSTGSSIDTMFTPDVLIVSSMV